MGVLGFSHGHGKESLRGTSRWAESCGVAYIYLQRHRQRSLDCDALPRSMRMCDISS